VIIRTFQSLRRRRSGHADIVEDMTKVQIRFRLLKPLDDAALRGIAAAHAIYGILKVQVAPSQDALMVEYDATRLRRAEVEWPPSSRGENMKPGGRKGQAEVVRLASIFLLVASCSQQVGGLEDCHGGQTFPRI
jgi:hypothetical protein